MRRQHQSYCDTKCVPKTQSFVIIYAFSATKLLRHSSACISYLFTSNAYSNLHISPWLSSALQDDGKTENISLYLPSVFFTSQSLVKTFCYIKSRSILSICLNLTSERRIVTVKAQLHAMFHHLT